jgi:hypothetical protein
MPQSVYNFFTFSMPQRHLDWPCSPLAIDDLFICIFACLSVYLFIYIYLFIFLLIDGLIFLKKTQIWWPERQGFVKQKLRRLIIYNLF